MKFVHIPMCDDRFGYMACGFVLTAPGLDLTTQFSLVLVPLVRLLPLNSSFEERVRTLKSLPVGSGPVERPAGTGIPFVSLAECARRSVFIDIIPFPCWYPMYA
jgi:hypothetical protein